MERQILQREAFPALDIIAAHKAMEHIRAPVCVFTDGRRIVGQLFLPDIDERGIVVVYIFSSSHVSWAEESVFLKTTLKKNVVEGVRWFLVCPGCHATRAKLYYHDVWKCAQCHGLHYRSQLVDKEVLLWERLDELEGLVARGRPKGMHNAKYAALREEYFRVRWKLDGRSRKYSSEAHNLAITSEWIAGQDIDLWASNYVVRNGHFVRLE